MVFVLCVNSNSLDLNGRLPVYNFIFLSRKITLYFANMFIVGGGCRWGLQSAERVQFFP